jgi:hypothetical protein
MDKSFRHKKSVAQIQRIVVLITVFLLFLLLIPFTNSVVSGEEITSFHIVAKDLNLLNFRPLLKEYLPEIECAGKISLEADLKVEDGIVIANGNFSATEVSLSGQSSFWNLNSPYLEGDFEAKFKGKNPEIKGKIKSPEFTVERLLLQNLEADYSFFEKKLNITECEVKLADGTVRLSSNMDFNESPSFFDFTFTSEGVNIKSIAEMWGASKPLLGTLFSDGTLSGRMGKPTTYSGRAKVQIKEGDLGKIGLIGRLITFSPLTTLRKDLPLTTLEGDFNISDGYATTDNTTIKGPDVRIIAKGDVGWNQKLDFILSLYASSELMKGTALTKVLGTIIDDFGNLLRRIKLTGTITNPEFTIVPLSIGETIKEGFEKSFKKGSAEPNTP